jgi:dTDP-4-dehydrorhamnose reductase
MKVLITGANGQLGQDLVKIFNANSFEVCGFGRDRLDVTDLDQSRELIRSLHPDVIVHAAAYTQVDQAETDVENAYLVNAVGTRNMAIIAEELNLKMCYISTDYVFDGTNQTPYNEFDQTNPLGVYGKSKFAGEELTKTLSTRYFIVRTSWVYGIYGNNFVKTMLRLAKEKDELGVVHDQMGSPTYTVDLACFIMNLIQTDKFGIYHVSNSGTCSWYDFAQAIFEEAGVKIKVNPITTDEFPRPAPRPKYSVLGHLALKTNGFLEIRHWRDGLKDFMKELNNG